MKRTLVALVAVVGALTSASAQTSAPHVALPGTERYDLTSKVTAPHIASTYRCRRPTPPSRRPGIRSST